MNNESCKSKVTENKINCRKIRKSKDYNSSSILEINIKYPELLETNGEFCQVFNEYYYKLSACFLAYCENKLYKTLARQKEKLGESFRAFGEIMKYYVSYCDNNYISIVTEITHFDGYFHKSTRFSLVWDVNDCKILPSYYFLNKAGINFKKAKKIVQSKILDEISSGCTSFGYTDSSLKKYLSKINPDNFFLTENGIAFWYNIGTIAPHNEGFPSFVVECDIFKDN